MSQNWLVDYQGLIQFIGSHPEIKIEPASMVIPSEVRPEFYRLFDATRLAIVHDSVPELLFQAEILSRNYSTTEKSVRDRLELSDITLPNPLGWFLRDPAEGLMRELFDPLFDLLKGKVDIKSFQDDVSARLRKTGADLYGQGYDKWLALSLILLLDSDKSFQVAVRRPAEHREWTVIRANSSEEIVPEPRGSDKISFVHLPENIFNVPDFIVHSNRLDKYVSFRGGLSSAVAAAFRPSERREWLPIAEPLYSESNPLLVYLDDDLSSINLVADAKRICRPNLIILPANSLSQQPQAGWLEQAAFWHDTLNPSSGTYIIGQHLQATAANLPGGVRLLDSGFDVQELETIVEKLADKGPK
jgi:hypothetical protein